MRVLFLSLALWLLLGSAPAIGQTCTGCWDRRPPSRPPLAESHPRLARTVDAFTPEQVHLAFAGPASYVLTWVTYPLDDPGLAARALGEEEEAAAARRRLSAATAEQPAHLGLDQLDDAGGLQRARPDRCKHVVLSGGRSVVQYSTQNDTWEHTVESPDPVACYSSGPYVSGAIHRVQFGAGLEGPLPPNTTIFYRVGDPDRVWSKQYSFRTAPLVGQDALPYRLGLVGDLGQTDHSLSTLDHLLVSAPDSIVLTGDLSYADGYQPRWDTWGRLVEPHTATQVWMYCVGNHEIELTDGVKDFVAYETRFYFPYRQALSPSKLFYSYDVAGAHIIMLGSYAPYGPTSEQYEWLHRDLAAVDRARTPWVIAAMHAPWYNSNYAHQGEGEAMAQSMEELLYQHGVDFVFSGHVHAYERHHRVFRGKLDECAPIHINIGDGGNKEGPDKKWYEQPEYSAFREPSFGHGTLDLLDATHAEWRWHRNQDDGPESADSVSVVRNPECKHRAAARLAQLRRAEAAALAERGHAARRSGGGAAEEQLQQSLGEQRGEQRQQGEQQQSVERQQRAQRGARLASILEGGRGE